MKKLQIFEDAPGFEAQTVSIDFDGVTEQLESSSITPGFDDTWTIAFWAKVNDVDSSGTFFAMFAGISGENIRLFHRVGIGTDPSIQFFTDDNNVAWEGVSISDNTWHHYVIQWDGFANGKLYIDALDQGAPGATLGDLEAQTFTNVSRYVSIAKSEGGVPRLEGRVASFAVWDDHLTSAEITDIYNSGGIEVDLAADSGSYSSSSNLLHWFQLGRDSSDIGKDYGSAGTLYDLMDSQVDISAADIVSDVPS